MSTKSFASLALRTFLAALWTALVAGVAAPLRAAAIDPESELIPCDRADERIELTASAHLDPSCTWTHSIEIVASNVTLDCQGAHIAAPDRRYGVSIHAPADTPLTNVTVRNCHIEGYLNNIHIEREGFRALAEGVEYENGFSDILIENVTSLNSRGVGIFVDGYVEGVTLRNLHVEGSGSAGIYLEAGSKNCVVEDSTIVGNGFDENSPAGDAFRFAGIDFWFWGTGREGLAIDGSRFNVVRNNEFRNNTAGGIFLYKNCGEFVTQRPQRWFHRRYGADGNVIENNRFVDEKIGVWIAARMGQNTLPMECSDPQYLPGYSLDVADDNVVRDNVFENVTFGVRVEDDDAVVTGNTFTSPDSIDEAIVIGTRQRTEALAQPVEGTVVTGNVADIAGSPNPYRWIFGHTNTTFKDNRSLGRIVGLCEGVPPPVGPFVMTVVVVVLEDPENPPNEVRELPPPAELPPCETACENGAVVARPRVVVQKLDAPPGDETLSIRGEFVLPTPFEPALDPVATGVALVIEDANGARPLDVTLPGGAFDRVAKSGWIAARNGRRWKWVDRSAAPPGGIVVVKIEDLSRKEPGRIRFRAVGKRAAYAIDPNALPLSALVVLDPPTAPTGQCGVASFAGPATCRTGRTSVKCK